MLTGHVYRKYLSDPSDDVRIATEGLLGEFLREIQEITMVQRAHADGMKKDTGAEQQSRKTDAEKESLPDITMASSERATFLPEHDDGSSDTESVTPVEEKEVDDGRDRGSKHEASIVGYAILNSTQLTGQD